MRPFVPMHTVVQMVVVGQDGRQAFMAKERERKESGVRHVMRDARSWLLMEITFTAG